MRQIAFSKRFEKHYKQRVLANQKLGRICDLKFKRFMTGKSDALLKDHALSGRLEGKRAFSINSDVRVIYKVEADTYIFLDIGTHNQVY